MPRPHGSYAKYTLDRCRCQPCHQDSLRYANNRRRAMAYGTWQPYVDAEPIRQHVRTLGEFGIGWMRLAVIAGVPRGMLSKLLYGDPKRGQAPSKRILPKNAAALLAIEPTIEHLGAAVLIDGTGTRRRLQALVAAGWPKRQLAFHLGMDPANFGPILARDDQVKVGTFRAITALYDQLWKASPLEHGIPEHTYRRVRSEALTARWAPVGAWDDDQIDNPNAHPDWTGQCGTPAGYRAHYRHGIKPACQPCRDAKADRQTTAA